MLAALAGGSSATAADPGLLRVTSSPAVPSQILVDGQIADSWGLNWLKEPPGTHTVCFAHADGWTEPTCQNVTVNGGATTTVTGSFTQRGYLHVSTSPAVASQVTLDGNPTDDWGVFTDVSPGPHQVCFGKVAGYDPPACQSAVVTAGALTTITGIFASNPSARGQSGVGLLRAVTSPAVPSQISIQQGATTWIADTWGLTWLELPPGSYTMSFSHVSGYTEPAPQTVTVTAGSTTMVTGTFVQRGSLRVTTSPPTAGTITVDGISRDDWGMWTDIPAGAHTVCFGQAAGYANVPACQAVTANAGVETDVTGNYSPAQAISLGDWQVVDSPDTPIGAGPNYWSASNVWVDQAGLHLRVSNVGGRWYCAEVVSNSSFGYGTYSWSVSSPVNNLDPNVVLGLFTWNDDPAYNNREIDFEASRWGIAGDPTNAQFVVQPWQVNGNLQRITMTGGSSTISFTWEADSVTFHYNNQTWLYTGSTVPQPYAGVQMNLYLMNGQSPTDNQPTEVVVSGFGYTP
jgi:hypothetical protein